MKNELIKRLRTIALASFALATAVVIAGCNTYGGSSVPRDDDAGLEKQPPGSVDGSVPLDEDGG
ncbi:MAG TPA: hypothetical protein PK402_03725 [Tepidisphaeraceae bacterium]|nr:hypothetical protein [Tepidisphaeraceae bacterium]